MPETPPTTQVRTKAQLLQDFFGGQEPLIKIRNLIETMFDGSLQSVQNWTTTYGQRSRSSRDRASDEVNLSEFTGYDPSGAASTAHTALESAWAAMISRGRSRVIVPPGVYRFGATPNLQKTWVDGLRCELQGAGAGVTAFIAPTTGHGMNIGALGGALTGNIGFSGFTVAPGNASEANDYAFHMEKCRDVIFKDVNVHLCKNGWGIGLDTTLVGDRILGVHLLNCSGRLQSNPGGAWVRLVGGEQLHVYGGHTQGRYNQYFIHQAGSDLNSDGIYVLGHFSEQWGNMLRVTGHGMVNLRLYANQFDRSRHFIYIKGEPGSSCRNWQINSQLLGHGSATVTISIASPGVITWAGHDIEVDQPVRFTTSSALPTGITSGTVYYVKTVLSADTFTISATPGGATINTSGTQSGTHSGFDVGAAALHFDATDTEIEAITVYGSAFVNRYGPVGRFIANTVDDKGPYVLFNTNYIRECGITGVPLFEIGEDANPNFFGNEIHGSIAGTSLTPYTYAFNYAGASTGRRKTEAEIIANNIILDFATGEVDGTP